MALMFNTLSVNNARFTCVRGGRESCVCLIIWFFKCLSCLLNKGLALRIARDISVGDNFLSLVESLELAALESQSIISVG